MLYISYFATWCAKNTITTMLFAQYAKRDDLPALGEGPQAGDIASPNTAATEDNTQDDSTDQGTDDSANDGTDGTTEAVEAATTSQDWVVPEIKVPLSQNNPFIERNNNPAGTVFIAVAACLGGILFALLMYYLIIGIISSRMANKNTKRDKREKEKFSANAAYGFGPSSLYLDFGTRDSKVPLLNRALGLGGLGSLSNGGDNSTINISEVGAMSNQDLTKMFVSPTADMQHKRARSYAPSMLNMSFGNTSMLNLPAGNRHLTLVPLMYLDANISELNVLLLPKAREGGTGEARRTIPSMYLEDLIDLDKQNNDH